MRDEQTECVDNMFRQLTTTLIPVSDTPRHRCGIGEINRHAQVVRRNWAKLFEISN